MKKADSPPRTVYFFNLISDKKERSSLINRSQKPRRLAATHLAGGLHVASITPGPSLPHCMDLRCPPRLFRGCQCGLSARFSTILSPATRLYLVGDIIDLLADAGRGLCWPQGAQQRGAHACSARRSTAREVIYVPGNHDDPLREHTTAWSDGQRRDSGREVLHECADGRACW
jgi:hypothetical protein